MESFADFKKKFSILIVDDIESNLFVLTQLLKKENFETIRQANNGVEALEILDKQKIDLVLLDIMMPKLNGYEVLEKIKDKVLHGEVMVIMISAASELESVVRCIKLGAQDFLQKPFDPHLLRARINSCVERRWYIEEERSYLNEIEIRQKRYEELLHVILPSSIVKELLSTNAVTPKKFNNVAIVFADVVEFTSFCDTHTTNEIVKNLQEFAEQSEILAAANNLQKIKTSGDAFMAAANMFDQVEDPVLNCIHFSKALIEKGRLLSFPWEIRIGIAYGGVIGGVVGRRQYLFDVWGDTVNTAARMQQISKPGKIFLNKKAWLTISHCCEGISQGFVQIKGKGKMEVILFEDFFEESA
jgi:DNA-binding response OmpR family regulator